MKHDIIVINSKGKVGNPQTFKLSNMTLKRVMADIIKSIQEEEDRLIIEELERLSIK